MKIQTVKMIAVSEWDKLVCETYGRPYKFQQQDDCRPRGIFCLTVPALDEADDYENETVPEEVNHPRRGVSFAAWLKRDPKQPLRADDCGKDQWVIDLADDCGKDQWAIDLWWHRNFYPDVQMVANDLHAKGLLKAGSYVIDIDW